MSQHNRATIKLARLAFGKLAEEFSTPEKAVQFRFVELGFAQVEDPEERTQLRRMATSFNLGDEEIDRLIGAARELVRESPVLAAALSVLDVTSTDD